MSKYAQARTSILAVFLGILCIGYTFAQSKVVVVPLGGDDNSHEHPPIEYINLSATAFRPARDTTSFTHSDGLLIGEGTFVANLQVPNGAVFKSLTAIYIDGDTAGDVRVTLFITDYSDITELALAGVVSTGFSFSQFTKRSDQNIEQGGEHFPIDNDNHGYFISVVLRNQAVLRGVVIGHTPGTE